MALKVFAGIWIGPDLETFEEIASILITAFKEIAEC